MVRRWLDAADGADLAGHPPGRAAGAGDRRRPHARAARPARANTGYPSIAQIAGHALSGIFLDALSADIERLDRINRTLALLSEAQRLATPLRPVQALVIAPSQRLDDLAAQHIDALPVPVRALLGGVGVSSRLASQGARGAALASYLLFEAPYTQALIALGEADTLARRDEVLAFFDWHAPPARCAAPVPVLPPAQPALR